MEKGNWVCSPSIRGYNRPLWFDTVGAPDVIWKRPSFWAIVEQFFEASKQEMIQLFVILQIRDICRVRMGRWIAISFSVSCEKEVFGHVFKNKLEDLEHVHGVGFSNFVEWDNLVQLFTKSPNDAITAEVDVKIIESSF